MIREPITQCKIRQVKDNLNRDCLPRCLIRVRTATIIRGRRWNPISYLDKQISALNPVDMLNNDVGTLTCKFGRAIHNLVETHCRLDLEF